MAADDAQGPLCCPFCGYLTAEGQYAIRLHIETVHPEGGESPFVVRDRNANVDESQDSESAGETVGHMDNDKDEDEDDDDEKYQHCPVDGCDEWLVPADMEDHLQLHADEAELDSPSPARMQASSAATDSPRSTSAQPREKDKDRRTSRSLPPTPPHDRGREREREREREHARAKSPRSNRRADAVQIWRSILNMPGPKAKAKLESQQPNKATSTQGKRLGKAELGKYAHEKKMPDWLVSLLKRGGQVQAEGVIPVLRQLLEQSPTTRHAYLCHPCVQHVSKLRREGGFCGYRNIQMTCSYIIGAKHRGSHLFKGGKLPSIFHIQDYIEEAWDMGINAQGRVETGGVRGTRKYIGTPEALAVFRRLDIPCDAQGFKHPNTGHSEVLLFAFVERYFQEGIFDPEQKVRCTELPPLYFQHAGHSMTIVGVERLESGGRNLLVFDPMFHDPASITRLIGRKFTHRHPDTMLKPYRRGNKYLKKYREFEVLRLMRPAEGSTPKS